MHSYQENLSLIQIYASSEAVLVDPLEVKDLTPLIRFFDTGELWLHGMDYDLSLFRNKFQWMPNDAKDTQVAAQLAGYTKFGLASLLEECFGVVLSKESQRADWGMRPLPQEMLDYAVNDVLYLFRLADLLMEKLTETDRVGWFLQSCDQIKKNVMTRKPKDPEEAWKIKGFGKLDRHSLAYLREIWRWREGEAEKLDKPSYKVLANGKMIFMSERLSQGKPTDLQGRYNETQKSNYAEAIDRVSAMSEDEYPEKFRAIRVPKPDDLDAKVNKIKTARNRIAQELEIDPTLIATKFVMEQMILNPEEAISSMMEWQKNLMADVLP